MLTNTEFWLQTVIHIKLTTLPNYGMMNEASLEIYTVNSFIYSGNRLLYIAETLLGNEMDKILANPIFGCRTNRLKINTFDIPNKYWHVISRGAWNHTNNAHN